MRNRSSRLGAALALACGIAAAQSSAADQTAAVAGKVTNSVSGEAILRAHVFLRQPGDQSAQSYGALTDAEGKFSVLRVPPGTYTVSVEKVGYLPSTIPNFEPPTQVRLGPGDKKEDVALKLMPSGALVGHVTDSNGEPIEGAVVKVSGPGNDGAFTDGKGQFRVGGLRPGKYRVWAFETEGTLPFPPETRTDGTAELNHRLTYYPGSPTVKTAAIVRVTPGGETGGIDIQLLRTPMLRISGKVIGMPKNVRATVQLQSKMSTGRAAAGMVKPDGTFDIWRPDPGSYRVIAMLQGGPNGVIQTAPVEIEVEDSNIEGLELRVAAPFDVAGSIRYDDDDAKPPGADASRTKVLSAQGTQAARAGASVLLQDTFGIYGRQFRAPLQPDGSFSIRQVTPGRYLVSFTWAAYAKSMQLGPTHVDGRVLDLRNGTGDSPVSIVVAAANAEISGSVRSGADVAPGRIVAVLPDQAEGIRPSTQVTRPDGSYRLANLAPGKYKLAVIDAEDQNQNPFERADVDDAIEITVVAGEKISKDLTVKPSGQ